VTLGDQPSDLAFRGIGMQPGHGGCLFVTCKMAGDQVGKAFGAAFLHVLAAMLAKCLPSALRAHDAGLSRAGGKRKRIVAHRGEQPSFRGPTEPALPVTRWAYLRRIRPVPAEERDRRFTAWMHWFLGCLDRAFDWAGATLAGSTSYSVVEAGAGSILGLGPTVCACRSPRTAPSFRQMLHATIK